MKKKTLNYLLGSVIALIIVIGACLFFIEIGDEVSIETHAIVAKPALTKVDIGYKKHIGYSPVFIAVENGYFEEEGIKPNLVMFDSTNQMLAAIVSGDVDVSIGGANIATSLSMEEKSPGSVKIFTAWETNSNTAASCGMVKKDSEIMENKDLEGAVIGALPGTFSPVWIEDALNAEGIEISDVEITGVAPKLQLAALESGQVDAVFTGEPMCTVGVNKGIARVIDEEPFRHFGSYIASSVISAELIEESPETAEKIVRANDKAIDFIRANPEETSEIIAKHTGFDKELIAGLKNPAYSKSTEVRVDDVQDIADKLYAKEELKTQIDVEDVMYK